MMRNIAVIFLSILFIIAALQSKALAQDQYKYSKRENREEGRIGIGISAPDLELLSFVGYREKVDPDSSIDLKIRFYLPKDTKLYITAKELKVREFYLMKPLQINWPIGWQEFSPWPTKDVLQPLGLSLDDLGILGRVNRDRVGSGEIAPLIIYHSNLPSNVNRYTLHLLPKEDLKRVEYKLYEVKENVLLQHDRLMNLFGGVLFSITINLSHQSAGYYKLVLDGKYRNKFGKPQRTYYFYHNPNVE